jgi:transposase-like protein
VFDDDAYISRERTIFVCYQFFKSLRKKFGRKAIFTQMVLDGIYMDACKWWLRLKHQVYATELKNIMERFIQKIKDRTQNVLMITFHVDRKVAIDNMLLIGSKCLFYICI